MPDRAEITPRVQAIPLVQPIQLSTTFVAEHVRLEDGSPLLYRRQADPAHFAIEARFAALEGAAESMLFCSGMAAITSVLRALGPGDEVLMPRSVYWTLRVWLDDFRDSHAFRVRWMDTVDARTVAQLAGPATRLVWIEAPANPSLRLPDIGAIACAKPAHALLAVDATCASPSLLQPIAHGSDLVLHSLSKCVGGHNDLLGGVLSVARRSEFSRRVRTVRWATGNALGPLESHLLSRSLDTLDLRMRSASASALRVARRLQAHPAVRSVVYPGLASHVDHAVANMLMPHGQGCLIGLVLEGGAAACKVVCNSTRLWRNATSFGGTISLIEHRQSAEYRVRQSDDDYLRLSVGLEPAEALIDDLAQALAAATPARPAAAPAERTARAVAEREHDLDLVS